jgi:hypothetical protein
VLSLLFCRLLLARAYHSRSYSSGESTRPMRQFSEKNESGPQPLIYYILVCLFLWIGLSSKFSILYLSI